MESEANVVLGVSSVMVLCSRCVPNCFAVVENVVPTDTGPSVDFVTFGSSVGGGGFEPP